MQPSPPISLVHTSSADPSSLTRAPRFLVCPLRGCKGAEPVQNGVEGATFLTFHFMRSASVTFGSSARVRSPSLDPRRWASYNAKRVESLQRQNSDSPLPLLLLSSASSSPLLRGQGGRTQSMAAIALQIPIDKSRGNWPYWEEEQPELPLTASRSLSTLKGHLSSLTTYLTHGPVNKQEVDWGAQKSCFNLTL